MSYSEDYDDKYHSLMMSENVKGASNSSFGSTL